MTTGRGAWTHIGGTTPYYEYTTPMVGLLATGQDPNSFDYRAVNYGVKAIQARLNGLGYPEPLVVDGEFGPKTKRAVQWFQGKHALDTNGRVGFVVAKLLFRGVFVHVEQANGIPGHYLGGIGWNESAFDPGAVGYYTPWDKGLVQWNCDPATNPSYTVAQAFDPTWAIEAAGERFAHAWQKYTGKGSLLQVSCSIAQHNSPLWADEWFSTGVAPNDQIKQYVDNVRGYAAQF